ncbi:MAG: T9SS type A sorting domain-containing protein [Cytophagaceae bacterium]
MRVLVLLFLMALSHLNFATSIITVVDNNGDWSDASTWDLNRLPTNGDIVKIPSGKTVQVSLNVYHSVPQYVLLQIQVSGTLQFVASGQLNLQCQSSVCTIGLGKIPATGCNCNQITMGTGEAAWKGDYASVFGGACVTSPCASLPVNIVDFEAKEESGVIALSWTAAQEINLEGYQIERSGDGIHFDALGSQPSFNSANTISYSYTDLQPLQTLSYYRLKILDKDQSASYSSIIQAAGSASAINVYPNPATGGYFNVLIPVSASLEKVSISLKDGLGKEVISLDLLSQGEILTVPCSSLSSGIYMLSVQSGKFNVSTRLVIQ